MSVVLTKEGSESLSMQILNQTIDIRIRSANPKDIPALGELWIYHRHYHEQWDNRYATIPSAQKKWEEQIELYLNHLNHCILVAEDKLGKIIGYVHGSFHSWPNSPFQNYGSLNSITVAEEVQGQGIGKNLIQSLLNWFKKHQIQHISLHVDYRNQNALKLYYKTGFRAYQHRLMLNLEKI
ncbi:MAG: GNAT family N-acetyltransferase [Promethearchaeota archaeon]